jgi:hypothetical protein
MQLAADERRPKSLLRPLKVRVSSLSERTAEEPACGSRSGANAPNRCECAGSSSSTRTVADRACVFESCQSRSGEKLKRPNSFDSQLGFGVLLGRARASLWWRTMPVAGRSSMRIWTTRAGQKKFGESGARPRWIPSGQSQSRQIKDPARRNPIPSANRPSGDARLSVSQPMSRIVFSAP